MFYFINFILSWLIWVALADKNRWRELFTVSVFALSVANLTDGLMHHYILWDYAGARWFTINFFNNFGIYMVVPYLFIQWLPKKRNFKAMFLYLLIWTAISLGIEWGYLFSKHMKYYKWWNLGCSYLADWFLFWVFYQYYKIFRLEKLSEKNKNILKKE